MDSLLLVAEHCMGLFIGQYICVSMLVPKGSEQARAVVDSQTSNAYKSHIIVNILTEDKIKRLVVIFVQIFPYKGDTWLLHSLYFILPYG